MSKFRYICGGDEGNVESGSGVVGRESVAVFDPSRYDLGKGAGASLKGRCASGGGAPLTNWSRREAAM